MKSAVPILSHTWAQAPYCWQSKRQPALARHGRRRSGIRGGRCERSSRRSRLALQQLPVNSHYPEETALAAAMTDQNLNNVMVQYYPGGKITTLFFGSQILAGPPPAVVSQGDVENLVSSMCNAGQFDNFDLSTTVMNFLLPSGTILNTNLDPTTVAISARMESPGV